MQYVASEPYAHVWNGAGYIPRIPQKQGKSWESRTNRIEWSLNVLSAALTQILTQSMGFQLLQLTINPSLLIVLVCGGNTWGICLT